MKNIKFELLKKAWKVKDLVLGYDSRDHLEIVYADTAGKAKLLCSDYTAFLNTEVCRAKEFDKILHNGKERFRNEAIKELAEAARINKRKNAVLRFPETEMFYVQHGYVGNSICWWGKGGCGYPCDINKAEKYTRQEILNKFINEREDDRIWAASHVEKHISKHVDAQNLNYKFVS